MRGLGTQNRSKLTTRLRMVSILSVCVSHYVTSCFFMSDTDELAEIDGIKPNVSLQDGEEQEVSSASRRVHLSSVLQFSGLYFFATF
jgi:hypothetical protein